VLATVAASAASTTSVVGHLPAADAGPDRVVVAGEPVTFYPAATAADEPIVEYRWDLQGDGETDRVFSSPQPVSFTFRQTGTYYPRLTVRDESGTVARDTCRIVVVAGPVDDRTAQSLLQPVRQPLAAAPGDGYLQRYAIMINGGYEDRFWTDVELTYAMLTERYGFADDDIYLLSYDGSNPAGQNPGGMIDGAATLGNLETAFTEVAGLTDGDDEVLVWITDHGRGYMGPQSEGGQYLGYMDGRASVEPGDEPDFPESAFPLRSLFTGGDYRCNHGLGEWRLYQKSLSATRTRFTRYLHVSTLDAVYVESEGGPVSDSDLFLERLTDYALGDLDRDGIIDTATGELFDYDGDGIPPYNPANGGYDEDDWGNADLLDDDFSDTNSGIPEGGHPYVLFDEGHQGKVCIDLGYSGGPPEVDGRDEDGAGLFDWIDANQDGDTDDMISIDEAVCMYDDELYDDHLAELIELLPVARTTVVAEPCFSGGLVEDLTATSRVICTATIEDAVSWGNLFIRSFTAALHGKDEWQTPVDADTNGDGAVSMLEAFNYAAVNDYYDEIPQYDDNGDGSSHPAIVPAAGDGSLGETTFLEGTTPSPLFADGFERGDTSRWSQTVG
jgi:PKD repeat protein